MNLVKVLVSFAFRVIQRKTLNLVAFGSNSLSTIKRRTDDKTFDVPAGTVFLWVQYPVGNSEEVFLPFH